MNADTQQNPTKRSSRAPTPRWGLRHLPFHAPELLREVANLREDGIDRFRQKGSPCFDRYGKQELIRLRDELRALWTRGKEMPSPLAIAWKQALSDLEKERERAPQQFGNLTLQEFICNQWLNRAEHGGLLITWEGRKREIAPDPYELPALLAYCAYLFGDKLRVCRNPDCPAAYFVAQRRDQKYCSAECAAPSKRAAKLHSWYEHKDKWPSQRKRAKPSRRTKR
jgi:hypothetical protein